MHRHLDHFNTQVGQYGPSKFGGCSGCLECSLCPVPSIQFKSFNAIAAWESFIGSFSLSELVFLGSLRTHAVYSRSPPTWTHVPESDEDPESCILFNDMGSTLSVAPILTHWVCFFHGLYFSVLQSWSSVSVCFPHFILIFKTTWIASLGMSHTKNPEVKSQLVFRCLVIFLK